MTTATTIITDALGLLGVVDPVEALEADDASVGLRTLNRLVGELNVDVGFAYATAYTSFALPGSTATRTIGPSGADITLTRPNRVEIGGYATVDSVDYPIGAITRQQYSEITQKTLMAIAPTSVYYEASSPNGTLYFWPLVSGSTTIKLPFVSKLTAFADLTTDYTLPDGYESLFVNCLAIALSGTYRAPVPPDVDSAATRLRRLIKRQNSQALQLDVDLPQGRDWSVMHGGYV